MRGHLQFLNAGDLALRIEHRDAGALRIRESGKRRLAGIPGGRGDNHDPLIAIPVRRSGAGHQSGKDLQRDVLERTGRPVEQFHDEVVAQRFDRSDALIAPLGAVCLGDALGKLLLGVVVKQHRQHLQSNLLIAFTRKIADVNLRLPKGIGDEQTAIVGDALAYRLLGCECLVAAACAMESAHALLCPSPIDGLPRHIICGAYGAHRHASVQWNKPLCAVGNCHYSWVYDEYE